MQSVTLTPTAILAGVGVLLSVLMVWRSAARRARAAADAARASARLASLASQVLLTACLLVGVQWVVITHPGNQWVLFVVLVLPDLLAAHVLTRALTMTTVDARAVGGRYRGGRGHRRGGAR
jgi:cytochrome b561